MGSLEVLPDLPQGLMAEGLGASLGYRPWGPGPPALWTEHSSCLHTWASLPDPPASSEKTEQRRLRTALILAWPPLSSIPGERRGLLFLALYGQH